MNQIRQPAEWEPHTAVWTAFPSHADLWQDALEPARSEFTAMCRAIADVDPSTGRARGEQLRVMAHGVEAVRIARIALEGLGADVFDGSFGDIWFRDTGPIFVKDENDQLSARCFSFNGWGGKYVLPYDDEVADQIARRANVDATRYGWILEGGSIDSDGEGTCLTTRQCLLNPNRNAGLDVTEAEKRLRNALGFEKVLWIEEGLAYDHTDGHVDNLTRFLSPGKVACPEASGEDDPNAALYDAVAKALSKMTDAKGRPLEVVRVPSPGRVLTAEGDVTPASHMNFYISNTRVIVPTYEDRHSLRALDALRTHFPGREVVGCRANHILLGGGSFHCITQNQW